MQMLHSQAEVPFRLQQLLVFLALIRVLHLAIRTRIRARVLLAQLGKDDSRINRTRARTHLGGGSDGC